MTLLRMTSILFGLIAASYLGAVGALALAPLVLILPLLGVSLLLFLAGLRRRSSAKLLAFLWVAFSSCAAATIVASFYYQASLSVRGPVAMMLLFSTLPMVRSLYLATRPKRSGMMSYYDR